MSGGQTRLWERARVDEAAARLLTAVRSGRGGLLAVLGEAGLGKSTALERVRSRVGSEFRVGRARGDPMEATLPFGVMAEAVAGVGGRTVLDLTDRGGPVGRAPLDVHADRLRAFVGWVERTASPGAPLLLVLDDLHWADPDSLNLLAFLGRRLAPLPVGIVAGLRPWPPAAAELVTLLAHDGCGQLERLAALSEPAAAELLAERTGSTIDARLARHAFALSGGNPLLLEQLALAIGRGEDVESLGVGTGQSVSDELLLGRFAGVSALGLRYAQAAAVLGDRFSSDLAGEVARLDDAEVDRSLEELVKSGLLQAGSGHLLEFVHPLFAQALRDDLAPPLLARLHRRAFAVLVSAGRSAEAAEHALRGAPIGSEEAVQLLERVGREALQAGALSAAAQRLEGAARLAGDRAGKPLLLALGQAMIAVGRPAEAIAAYERLLREPSLDRPTRALVLRMVGRALFATRRHAEAAARFEEAGELALAIDQNLAAEASLDHALASWITQGPAVALPLAGRAQRLAGEADPGLRSRVEAASGYFSVLAGDAAGLEACARAARAVLADRSAIHADLNWAWGVLVSFAYGATYLERLAEAEEVFQTGLGAAEEAGAVEPFLSLALGYVNCLGRLGRLQEALDLAERAAATAALVPMERPFVPLAKAGLLLAVGRLQESEAWCDRAESIAERRGEGIALLRVWHVRGQLCLAAGDPELGQRFYRRIEEAGERLGIGEPCMLPWARSGIAAHLACGQLDAAGRLVQSLEASAERLPCRWPRIAAAVGRASIAEAQGDGEEAERRYDRALELHREVKLPLELAETLLGYGTFLRRAGRPSRARPLLAEALDVAEASGAGRLVALTGSELRVTGGRRRRLHEEPDRLTGQEERVVALAAQGHSNQEIARQLFVSVRTVETHLQHAYAKLGVASRRQLIAMAAANSPYSPRGWRRPSSADS